MDLNKRGAIPALIVLVVLVLAVGTGVVLTSTGVVDSPITGAVIGPPNSSLETGAITACNITISEDINNIGHDYECEAAHGFIVGADDITIDCQNHSISCIGGCSDSAGFLLDGDSGVTIQNCRIYNFDDGIRARNNASNNLFTSNILENNSDGIDLNDVVSNNVTLSYLNNNTVCGINVSDNTHDVSETSKYNRIWNNKFFTNGTTTTGAAEACNDLTSYTYWYLEKNCEYDNIDGGPCLAGNYWSTYTGTDVTGDGLGDSDIPYQDGGIEATAVGDIYPLVDQCTLPGVVGEDTVCPETELLSDAGDGVAIVESDTVLECNGTVLNGNRSTGPWTWTDSMKGIEIIGVHNVTIRGCEIHDFKFGIYISNSYNINLEDNYIHNNNHSGIYVTSLAYNITIDGNNITNDYTNGTNQSYGVYFVGSYPAASSRVSQLTDNIIQNATKIGVYLYSSSDYITLDNNDIRSNENGTEVKSSSATSFFNNRFTDNFDTGLYLKSATSVADFGTFGTSSNNFSGNLVGLNIESSTSTSSITGHFTSNTNRGIVQNSSSIDIGESIISGSTIGVDIQDSSNIDLSGVNASSNTGFGIRVIASTGLSFGTLPLYLADNTVALYLADTNYSTLEYENYIFGDDLIIENNNQGIILGDAFYNNISGVIIYNSSIVGINITDNSDNNLIYNNNISNNTINAYDENVNYWNFSKTSGTNIISGTYIAGNYWDDYLGSDTTGDGLGDSLLPHNSSANILTGGDYYPLTSLPISCGDVSNSIILIENLTSDGDCFTVIANNVQIDFNGYSVVGNGSGTTVNVTGYDNVEILNALLENFTYGIYGSEADNLTISYANINVSNSGITFSGTNNSLIQYANITSASTGINVDASYGNTIKWNNLTDNSLGIDVSSSNSNTVYNNAFDNTQNANDDGSTTYWNYSYQDNLTNIIGGNTSGGNFWSDYTGKDNGGLLFPHDTSGDGIGDSQYPYATGITGGDYLPLTSDTSFISTCQEISSDTILTSDIYCSGDDGVTILADDITLDCNGYNISGTGIGAGVLIEDRDSVTIKDCYISGFYYGIKTIDSTNTKIIEDNVITDNDFYGIYLYNSNDTEIDNSTITNDNNGVYLISSNGAVIANNSIDLHQKFYGVYAYYSDDVVVYNNTFVNNYHGVYLVNSDNANITDNNITTSDSYSIFLHSETTGATVQDNELSNGRRGIYFKNLSTGNFVLGNSIFTHSVAGIYVQDSSSNNFTANILSNNDNNFYVTGSSSSVIYENQIIGSDFGLTILSSDSSEVVNNTINATTKPVFNLSSSDSVLVYNNSFYKSANIEFSDSVDLIGNTMQDTDTTLIFQVTDSDYINISENAFETLIITESLTPEISWNTLTQAILTTIDDATITENTITGTSVIAYKIDSMQNSRIFDNTVKSTDAAFVFNYSDSNDIYDNWVQNNLDGINFTNSNSNTIYNNYFENTNNVYEDETNTWQDTLDCTEPNIVGGPCKGGNFYSDYYGLDDGSGSSRDEGDGIGDNPAYYEITSTNSDTLPLVLYVARQYFAPHDTETLALTATGSLSGELSDEQVVQGSEQEITYSNSTGTDFLTMVGTFNISDVDATDLLIEYGTNATFVNVTGVTGILDNKTIYVDHGGNLDAGIYVCPNLNDLDSLSSSCSGRVNITEFPSSSTGYNAYISGDYYVVDDVQNDTAAIAIEQTDLCGANVYHDVVADQDILNCPATALNVQSSSITLDCGGKTLSGSGVDAGINITSVDSVEIKHCIIQDFNFGILVSNVSSVEIYNVTIINASTQGIAVVDSSGADISNVSITNSANSGILFDASNYSVVDDALITITSYGFNLEDSEGINITGSVIKNNTIGLNVSASSSDNLIYNNFFNNTENAYVGGTTTYLNTSVTSGTNVIGGTYLGGNFWSDYAGFDLDLDGIGDTDLPYNSSENVANGGDYHPLVEIGYIACLSLSDDLSLNQNISESVATDQACINVLADDITIDCNGYSLVQTGTGGIGINLTGRDNVTILDCNVENFDVGINLENTDYSVISGGTLSNLSNAIILDDSDYNNITSSTISDNDYGINSSATSNDNLIYNNYFDSTINALDVGTNWYNTSKSSGTNIAGGSYLGGNYWSDYSGTDTSGDKIGDNNIPYNASNNISVNGYGDYLPLVLVTTTTTTTSSSSGGGGGSSSSSGGGGSYVVEEEEEEVVTTTPSVTSCVEDWVCGDWDVCIYGLQERECVDLNVCGTYDDKPDEFQSCTVEEVTEPAPEPVPEAPDRTLMISSLALVALFGLVAGYYRYMHPAAILRRRLRITHRILMDAPIDKLKGNYKGIYKLYMKLSERNKQNFFANVSKIREHIEEQLRAEKEISMLFEKAKSGSLQSRKKAYLQIYEEYQKLSTIGQSKVYPKMVDLKDRLERGFD